LRFEFLDRTVLGSARASKLAGARHDGRQCGGSWSRRRFDCHLISSADATLKGGGSDPFAGIEAPYITCWKGFRTMLRFTGEDVGGARYPQAKALEPVP
jgi:hypothetical protein